MSVSVPVGTTDARTMSACPAPSTTGTCFATSARCRMSGRRKCCCQRRARGRSSSCQGALRRRQHRPRLPSLETGRGVCALPLQHSTLFIGLPVVLWKRTELEVQPTSLTFVQRVAPAWPPARRQRPRPSPARRQRQRQHCQRRLVPTFGYLCDRYKHTGAPATEPQLPLPLPNSERR